MIEPLRLEVRQGRELVITWDDRVDEISAVRLREACSCAGCRNGPEPVRVDEATCRIARIGLVGAYAINVTFAPDGHATGIYPFGALRALGVTG